MNIYRRILIIQVLLTVAPAQFDWIDNGAPIRQGEHIEWQRTADNGANGEVIFAWCYSINNCAGFICSVKNSNYMLVAVQL